MKGRLAVTNYKNIEDVCTVLHTDRSTLVHKMAKHGLLEVQNLWSPKPTIKGLRKGIVKLRITDAPVPLLDLYMHEKTIKKMKELICK